MHTARPLAARMSPYRVSCRARCLLLPPIYTGARPIAPHFSECLHNVWAPHGHLVTLTCAVTGYPTPDICWYKGDTKIVESANIAVSPRNRKTVTYSRLPQISFDGDAVCMLTIKHLNTFDIGTYVCAASNEHGHVRTACTVRIGKHKTGQPPMFLRGLQVISRWVVWALIFI
jgi:hypothetical protein